jgi:hypothetical protein
MVDIARNIPPRKLKPRRWAAAVGGNRLDRLRALVIGDERSRETLPADHPRRRPTRPRLAWLERTLEDEETAA